ncbi:hypothetical protein [Acidovorax sp. NB1]|nr:hypothetical protein [Acidovorax sp. NB1]
MTTHRSLLHLGQPTTLPQAQKRSAHNFQKNEQLGQSPQKTLYNSKLI